MANPKDNAAPPAANQPQPGPAPGKPMPKGTGPLEYRRPKNVHLARAGRVVKQDWIGRVMDRSVRVYYGAQESALPDPVRQAVLKSGIQIGIMTYQELGLAPPREPTGFVNLTEAGLDTPPLPQAPQQ